MTKKATRLYPPPACEIPAEAIYEDLELAAKSGRLRELKAKDDPENFCHKNVNLRPA